MAYAGSAVRFCYCNTKLNVILCLFLNNYVYWLSTHYHGVFGGVGWGRYCHVNIPIKCKTMVLLFCRQTEFGGHNYDSVLTASSVI